jgi:hypothetical protein
VTPLWGQSCHTPPPSPTLLASCEMADSNPNQIICPTRNCCHVLTEIAGQPGTDFSHRGEKSTPYRTQYTVHYYKYTVQTFSWLLLNLQQVAPNQEKPHTHSLPLPHVFFLYTVSVLLLQRGVTPADCRMNLRHMGVSWSTYESSVVGPNTDQKLLAGSGSGKNHSGSEKPPNPK